MADIKTRQSKKGTIRTIDRASAMTSHVKDTGAKTGTGIRKQGNETVLENYFENNVGYN